MLLKTSSGELAHDTHYLYNDYNRKVEKCDSGDKIKFNGYSLRKEYTAKEFDFVRQVSSQVHVQPFLDLQRKRPVSA